ncbi:hypothetical protein OROMI_015419 [Orobanche minor]
MQQQTRVQQLLVHLISRFSSRLYCKHTHFVRKKKKSQPAMAEKWKRDWFSSITKLCFINLTRNRSLIAVNSLANRSFVLPRPFSHSHSPPRSSRNLSRTLRGRQMKNTTTMFFSLPSSSLSPIRRGKMASQDGDTVPIGEMEPIDSEIGGNWSRATVKSEVVVLDSDSEEEITRVDMITKRNDRSSDQSRGVELGRDGRNRDNSGVSKINRSSISVAGKRKESKDSDVYGGNGRGASVVSGEGATGDKDFDAFDEITKFWYNASVEAGRRMAPPRQGVGKQQLPAHMEGKESGMVKKKDELDDVVKIMEQVTTRDERRGYEAAEHHADLHCQTSFPPIGLHLFSIGLS